MIFLPDYIKKVIEKIEYSGHKAYSVGGAVRDSLLGLSPDDYDICSSASPEEIISLFPHTVPTGIKHGTVTVISGGKSIEVTTFRNDGQYFDRRHPENVNFIGSIEDDLLRRDFTINALAFDGENLVDVTGGLSDLERKIIRAVGNPTDRFREDALRILRCFRFASQLGFCIEKETLDAALCEKESLKDISRERIAVELLKIFKSPHPQSANPLFLSGGLMFIGIPECEIPKLISNIEGGPLIRLSAFCRFNNIDSTAIADNLKLSNKMKDCLVVFKKVFSAKDYSRQGLKKLLRISDSQQLVTLLKAKSVLVDTDYKNEIFLITDIIAKNEPYKIDMLDIDGNVLKSLGFSGKAVGELLEYLLNMCIENPSLNKKDILTDLIHQKT